MLDSELPIDALAILADFLQISDASSSNSGTLKKPSDESLLPAKSVLPSEIARDIFAMSAVLRTELLRAQDHNLSAERASLSFVEETLSRRESDNFVAFQPLTPPSFSQRLQESMHGALMKVMEERDMSHARMAAAEVLHVHELEQQRKQNARLEAELEALRSEKPPQTPDRERDIRNRQMQQSSDDELMSLCQQLAGEISARTAASLEVVRLQEGRQIESEHHINEVQSLKDEIQRLRSELETEKAKSETMSSELSGWRSAYKDILKT